MSTTIPFPLFSKTYKNVDGSVLTDDGELQYNGFIDALEGLNVRPGEVLAYDLDKRNDGLFMWPDKNKIVSVSEGQVRLFQVSGSTLLSVGSVGTVGFGHGPHTKVTFASDGEKVFLAGGGPINYVDDAGTVTAITDTDAPIRVSHVDFIDGYILAINDEQNGDGKFYFSNIPTRTDWSALDFATAEGAPDKTRALHVVQRQIYLLGTTSTEIWENDGSSPFSRIPGGLIELGCIARYSGIKRENSLLWLNHERQFVEFTGTSVKILSSRYDAEIRAMDVVDDCLGGYAKHLGQEYCLFHFPTEGRTFCYNPRIQDWSEWRSWNSQKGRWEAYDFRAIATDINSGKVFVGKQSSELIVNLDAESKVDLVDEDTDRPFKFSRETGWIDCGTGQRKVLEQIRFRARRGSGVQALNPAAPTAFERPKLMFRYRNNGSQDWSNPKLIDLAFEGDTDHHIRLQRLGMFKSRKFEISATDSVAIALSSAEASITLIR